MSPDDGKEKDKVLYCVPHVKRLYTLLQHIEIFLLFEKKELRAYLIL